MPLAVMAAGSVAKIGNATAVNNSLEANTGSGLNQPVKNGTPKLDVASIFLAGKITDNIGGFVQFTWDFFGAQNADGISDRIHGASDNMDIRYADHLVGPSLDLIYGVSVNNNPSVSDPWNTSWAWAQYVPSSGGPGANTFLDATTPYPSSGLPGDLYAGVTAYAYWQKTIYAEIGVYRTADHLLHFMNVNNDPMASVLHDSSNPYWRLAYTLDWGAHSLMVGTSGIYARPYDEANGISTHDPQSYQTVKTQGLDTQYQYLLDPHTITAQLMYQHQQQEPSAIDASLNGTLGANLAIFRVKGSYVYRSRYGGSAAYFNETGDPSIQTRGGTLEAFVIPVQNIRVGLQYTMYSKLPSIDTPSNANTALLYVWAAY
jgi:hypothetical protein